MVTQWVTVIVQVTVQNFHNTIALAMEIKNKRKKNRIINKISKL